MNNNIIIRKPSSVNGYRMKRLIKLKIKNLRQCLPKKTKKTYIYTGNQKC